jgi:hypothetical protein
MTFSMHTARCQLPDGRSLTAEDWPDQYIAEAALDRAFAMLARYMAAPHPKPPLDCERLADDVADRLGVDLARPYGCSLIVGR